MKKLEINKKTVLKSAKKIRANKKIADGYLKLYQESGDIKFKHISDNVKNCFKFWDVEYYRLQAVKDIKRLNLCKDKFCKNCQNQLSKQRFNKFMPLVEKLASEFKVYHVVFSVPNVPGDSLQQTLDIMYNKFPFIIRYLNGTKKIKNVDFSRFGFLGAIRSLEITCKNTESGVEYHPHFHCLFVFKDGVSSERSLLNDFSFDRYKRKKTRFFSEDEILFQKIWRLLVDGVKVTKSSIEDLDQGYSLIFDKVRKGDKSGIKEVFKYTLKESFNDLLDSEDIFKTLYYALKGRRIIQGYGAFYGCEFEEDIDLSSDVYYDYFIFNLKKIEMPVLLVEKLNDVLDNIKNQNNNIVYISRKTVKSLVEDNESY